MSPKDGRKPSRIASGHDTARTYQVIKDPYPVESFQPTSEIAYRPTFAVLCHDRFAGSCELVSDLYDTHEEAEAMIFKMVAFDKEEATLMHAETA
jgi:hypothetical protein